MHLSALLACVGLLLAATAGAQTSAIVTPTPVIPAVTEPEPGVPEWWRNGGPRVRTTDGRTGLLLKLGLERSPRLKELVARVEAANVLVYLGIEPRLHSGLAGRLTFLGQTNNYRFLRVSLNGELSADQIIASIAHEMQHVVEVIDHPEVTDEKSLAGLYRKIGRENKIAEVSGWETAAAIQVSADVRRELISGAATALARRGDGVKR